MNLNYKNEETLYVIFFLYVRFFSYMLYFKFFKTNFKLQKCKFSLSIRLKTLK